MEAVKKPRFGKNDTTKEKLIKATQYLLACYGYEMATTREITRIAGTSLSAISFHFGTKEVLVKAAVDDTAENLHKAYQSYTGKMQKFVDTTEGDTDQAWKYIEELLSETMLLTFDPKKSLINIGMVEHENGFPESCRHTIASVAVKDNELILQELINYVLPEKDLMKSTLIARSISAAIMSYMEKPLLNEELSKATGLDLNNREEVRKDLLKYFTDSIRAASEA